MLNRIKLFFTKNEDSSSYLPDDAKATFLLKVDGINVGTLHCEDGKQKFKYTEDFKKNQEYNKIIEFSDLDKVYRSEMLWPFFQTRIPGLKQPAIQEKLKKDQIDEENSLNYSSDLVIKRFQIHTNWSWFKNSDFIEIANR